MPACLRKLWGIQRKLWKNLCLLVSPVDGVGEGLQPYFGVAQDLPVLELEGCSEDA